MIIIIYKDNKYTRNDNIFIDLVVGSPGIWELFSFVGRKGLSLYNINDDADKTVIWAGVFFKFCLGWKNENII